MLATIAVAFLLVHIAGAAAASQSCNELRARLVRGGGSASGLFVIDGQTGQPICRRAATRRLPLASNMKLFTTATALGRLGPDFQVKTRLLADGDLDRSGVLRGDLYLQGGGDPALGSPAFYDRFLGGLGTNLFALKGQLRATGVTAVQGRLYADDTIFDRLRGVADSGYATSPYIGPISGLSFNSGYSNSRGTSFASDPARNAAAKLIRSLRQAGISIRPRVALAETPSDADPLATVRSPTMSQLANATNVPSNNLYAEMLMKLIGARLGGTGSTQAGAQVVEQFARAHRSGVIAADGSGLTRTNRASPVQVVRLLQSMREEEAGHEFVESLAVAGQEGTVASRMHGTAADGHCRTKTGTLTGVSNLSGYCFNRSGRVMIFSILMGSVGNLSLAHAEQDRIAAAIASY
ncbi:MAG TPA: D-alanyl-D-alanine carboxypeptidase/D-alanyl-D-alanine-endopeptidase [Solirubrobacterales bacterium]|jgi:D-alanyl-D-alanine carboxypeptidase/D-alanyl-D-alanine-endopeptidase (penicillin-binding protein 4)